MSSSSSSEPLYLGFDLSTQQLKVLAVTSSLETHFEENISFDDELPHYTTKKGVHTNPDEETVYAPVAMWVEALDLLLSKMRARDFEFDRVRGISGAGQQHGSVYWTSSAEDILSNLDRGKSLKEQIAPAAFSHDNSPNWQDHSTGTDCRKFESSAGGQQELAEITGSKAHHRFTGPQILRFLQHHPEDYEKTARISLVSSFLASLFLGKIAPIDISDVCGMNLWNVKEGKWDEKLIALAASASGTDEVATKALYAKLGEVEPDGGANLGPISNYYVSKYGFSPKCIIAPSTGDNPSTILALPLQPQDAIVSLGTSTTLLMSTPKYHPSPAYHMFNHPTTPGLYMFMLCYKNGGLAREAVRDSINAALSPPPGDKNSWAAFNDAAFSTNPLGKTSKDNEAKFGFYFPLPEIVPDVGKPGIYRFCSKSGEVTTRTQSWDLPTADARAILESQSLSMRLRAHPLLPAANPQPRRVYLVGGGSRNPAIAKVIAEVLGGVEGVYKLDVGNACALGAAYKAVWSVERKDGETFEKLVGERWKEDGKVERLGDGYMEGVWEGYGEALEEFEVAETMVVEGKVEAAEAEV